LNPRNTWKKKNEYDKKAQELAAQFIENFKQYEQGVSKEILSASPSPTPASKIKGTVRKIK